MIGHAPQKLRIRWYDHHHQGDDSWSRGRACIMDSERNEFDILTSPPDRKANVPTPYEKCSNCMKGETWRCQTWHIKVLVPTSLKDARKALMQCKSNSNHSHRAKGKMKRKMDIDSVDAKSTACDRRPCVTVADSNSRPASIAPTIQPTWLPTITITITFSWALGAVKVPHAP